MTLFSYIFHSVRSALYTKFLIKESAFTCENDVLFKSYFSIKVSFQSENDNFFLELCLDDAIYIFHSSYVSIRLIGFSLLSSQRFLNAESNMFLLNKETPCLHENIIFFIYETVTFMYNSVKMIFNNFTFFWL